MRPDLDLDLDYSFSSDGQLNLYLLLVSSGSVEERAFSDVVPYYKLLAFH